MELDPTQPVSQHPPPPPKPAPPPTAAEAGAAFLETLMSVGLLGDLQHDSLELFLEAVPHDDDDDVWRTRMVRRYYLEPSPAVAAQRRQRDSIVVHDADRGDGARSIVARIAACTPETGVLSLERIGTADGPLVIRSSDDAFAAVNEAEEDLDTDEIDLSELEAAPTVAVRSLFEAVNILLDRIGARDRWVQLCGDGVAECYVRLSLVDALALCGEGYLADDDDGAVLDQGAWGRS